MAANVILRSGIDYQPSGQVVIYKNDGTQTAYKPTADTDAARGVALASAIGASAAGNKIFVGPGVYSVTSALALLDGQSIYLQSPTITNTTNTADIFTAASKTGWSINGSGKLIGAGIGTGGVYTDQAGVRITGTQYQYSIDGLHVSGFKGPGISLEAAMDGYYGGRFLNCYSTGNGFGMYQKARAEYNQVVGCGFVGNTTGCYVAAGNSSFVGCNFDSNTSHGFYLAGTDNPAHGVVSGCLFNHNSGYGVYIDAITAGHSFSNCAFSSVGAIYLNASCGINFIGGNASGPTIYLNGTMPGYNYVQGMHFLVSDLTVGYSSADNRPFLKVQDCFYGAAGTPSAANEVTESRSRKFTQYRVLTDLKSNITTPTNLKGAWFFGDGTSTTVTDASGNANNVTLSAVPHAIGVVNPGALQALHLTAAKYWSAGDDDDYSFAPTSPFTLISLVKPSSTYRPNLMSKGDTVFTKIEYWFAIYDNLLSFRMYHNSNMSSPAIGRKSGSIAADVGSWHVYAVTYANEGTTEEAIKLYRDGVQCDTGSWSSGSGFTAMAATTYPLADYIPGNGVPANTFLGDYSFAAIIAEELTAGQLANISAMLLAAVGG